MNKWMLLLIFTLAGCGNQPLVVANNKNRCKEFVREESTEASFVTAAKVLKRVPPEYPRKAAIKGMDGYVVMVFDITEGGKPHNIDVIESYPAKEFDANAKRALSEWVYEPAKKDNGPVSSICHKLTLEFKLG